MTLRAASVAETGDRVLDAAFAIWAEMSFDRIRLEALAERAQVTVPTIVRRYGGKAGVILALVEREVAELALARGADAGAPTSRVISELVDFYQGYGAMILKMYAEAPLVTGLPELAQTARAAHLAWCRTTFGARLPSADPVTTARRMAQVTAVCDATTWRILSADAGLTPSQVRVALIELLEPLLGGDAPAGSAVASDDVEESSPEDFSETATRMQQER